MATISKSHIPWMICTCPLLLQEELKLLNHLHLFHTHWNSITVIKCTHFLLYVFFLSYEKWKEGLMLG